MFHRAVGGGVMSSNENKFLNNARDFKKANPNATEYDFLDVDNYYKNYKKIDQYSTNHALRQVIKMFEPNTKEADRQTVDSLQYYIELKE